ncbi:MAG: hypothetical protein Fur0018_23950 [Anaerolineales bacterium]
MKDYIPSIQRTIQILELLLQNPEGLTTQELLSRVNSSRSTLFAMLRTLKALGYVEQGRERGRYQAGARLMAWRKTNITAPGELLAAFYREAERAVLNETLAIFQAAGGAALLLAQVESPHRVRSVYPPEQVYPPDQSAAARLLLTPDEHIRAQGYALHTSADHIEIAMPVCSDGAHPEAALTLSAPRHRLGDDDQPPAIRTLRALAARISYRLGALTYAPFTQDSRPVIGPTRPLSPQERDALLQEPWAARLVCLRPDGTPHIVPVWHAWDGEAFYLPAWEGSHWAVYLHTNPQLSISVDEPWPPLRRVVAQGQAHPLPTLHTSILKRISRRYLGEEQLSHHVVTLFRMQPDSIKGWHN